MSLHKFGYSAESLQKDKIENLEKELESQTKLFNLKLYDLSNNLENFNNLQEVIFDNGETKVLVNAKNVCRHKQKYRRYKNKFEILRTRY